MMKSGLARMRSGLGVRPELFGPIESSSSEFGFLEAHSENYFGESIARAKLLDLRERYPISLHGVGLSIGRADDLDQQHLVQLKQLVDEVDPFIVSEHLAWSAYSHTHLPDLLPLPLTPQALNIVCQHIDQMQNYLGRQILIENPSNYLLFDDLHIPEPIFLNTLAHRTGCGLLMDVNNIHVSASNVGRDGKAYIDAVNGDFVGQYHLAGYTEVERDAGDVVLIDTHNQTVHQPVWELFEHALSRHGAKPTLFEWDSDFPKFDVLLQECEKADDLLDKYPLPKIENHPMPTLANEVEADGSSALEKSQCDFLSGVLSLEKKLAAAKNEHQHRLWIYQNNVFGAIQEYLEEVYPATHGVLGAEFFKQFAQAYIQDSPPAAGNIHCYGVSMAQFSGQVEGLEGLPYIQDLMRYEWALHNAYYSKVSDALDPTSMEQEQLLTTNVLANDSASLICSAFPIFEIHRQSLPDYQGEVSISLDQSQDNILVYKLGFEVSYAILDDEQSAFIQEIENSKNLLQAIEALQGSISAGTLSSTLSLVFETRLLKAAA